MATISEIRQRVKELIERDIEGLKVLTYPPESTPSVLPTVVIGDASAVLEEGNARQGLDSWDIDLLVLVSAGDLPLALASLDPYLARSGEKSIRQVFADNADLGLRDGTDAELKRIEDYGPRTGSGGDIKLAGAVFRLVVRTSG